MFMCCNKKETDRSRQEGEERERERETDTGRDLLPVDSGINSSSHPLAAILYSPGPDASRCCHQQMSIRRTHKDKTGHHRYKWLFNKCQSVTLGLDVGLVVHVWCICFCIVYVRVLVKGPCIRPSYIQMCVFVCPRRAVYLSAVTSMCYAVNASRNPCI